MSKDYRKVNELRLWEQNPRSIKGKDFERLKKQIKELGQYKPLIITKDGEVIGGNMRLRAYQDLGIEEVWVSVVDPKDENEKLKYALSDNDRAGFYDDDMLANISSNYPDFEWGGYAVDMSPPQTLDEVLKDIGDVVEDEVPEVQEEAISKLGEVYQLCRHRLMCGDSTKIEDVEKLMNGQKADMVFTDPPYGLGYNYNTYKDVGGNEYTDFCDIWFSNLLTFSNKIVITVGWKYNEYWYSKKPYDVGYWVMKGKHSGGKISNFRIVEPIFFFGDFSNKYDFELWETTNVKQFVGETDLRDLHTCPKPLKLVQEIVEPQTKKEDLVLDIFGGSGTTLLVCEQLNRTCYMMEIDPKYCDVIRKRYAKFIGKEEEWEEQSPRI